MVPTPRFLHTLTYWYQISLFTNLMDLHVFWKRRISFLVEKKLFNKLDCDEDYEQNGSVSSTQVNASVPPEAFFNLDDEYCIEPSVQSDLIVLNQTQLGQYSGANSTDCQVDVTFTWEFSGQLIMMFLLR